jgi:hypothetical protein
MLLKKQVHRCVLNTSERILPMYEETPKHTVTFMIENVMQSMNFCGTGCCHFHLSAKLLSKHLRTCIINQPCNKMMPATDWQCRSCLAMQDFEDVETRNNDIDHLICSVCGDFDEAWLQDSETESGHSAPAMKTGSFSL